MNPLLTSSLLTALLQSSLMVTGAWLLTLTHGKRWIRRAFGGRIPSGSARLLLDG